MSKGDVSFYADDYKKPIAYSTVATNDFLVIVHEMYPMSDIYELKNILEDRNQWIRNPEAIAVLDAYIKAGAGNTIPNWR